MHLHCSTQPRKPSQSWLQNCNISWFCCCFKERGQKAPWSFWQVCGYLWRDSMAQCHQGAEWRLLHHTPVLILPASSSFYPLGVINAFVLHFGPCWFVRQWGSFGLGVPDASSHALTPGGDLHFFFGNLLLQPAHCQTSQHPACAGNDGNLEWPFFLVPLSPPEFPKTSQIGAWGLVKFFWTLSGRSLCVLAVPGSPSQCSQPPLHLFSSSGCALIKQFLNNLLSVESYFFAAGSPKLRKSRNAMNSQCVDWVRFLGM